MKNISGNHVHPLVFRLHCGFVIGRVHMLNMHVIFLHIHMVKKKKPYDCTNKLNQPREDCGTANEDCEGSGHISLSHLKEPLERGQPRKKCCDVFSLEIQTLKRQHSSCVTVKPHLPIVSIHTAKQNITY